MSNEVEDRRREGSMELEEVLARRRACRRFSDRPVPRGAAAGHRGPQALGASTASNVPYRHVMIVDDRRVIASVRQISPAMQADPPALVVILTDRKMAVERVGRIGEACALIDSGAAGENAWLAAVDAGLATGFTMISGDGGDQGDPRSPRQRARRPDHARRLPRDEQAPPLPPAAARPASIQPVRPCRQLTRTAPTTPRCSICSARSSRAHGRVGGGGPDRRTAAHPRRRATREHR